MAVVAVECLKGYIMETCLPLHLSMNTLLEQQQVDTFFDPRTICWNHDYKQVSITMATVSQTIELTFRTLTYLQNIETTATTHPNGIQHLNRVLILIIMDFWFQGILRREQQCQICLVHLGVCMPRAMS
jgi:hypothetical protein